MDFKDFTDFFMNSLHLYQIAIALIAAFMIYQGAKNFFQGKKNQTFLKLLTRVVVWGGMALIALFPDFTFWLAKTIGIEGNINAVILTGFIFVFLIIFKLLNAIEKLEQQMTEVTRKDSLEELKK
jgi:hypothetical protein